MRERNSFGVNKLKLAIASVGVAITGQAYAWPPTQTPDKVVYVAGGAEQNTVFQKIAESLFLNDSNLHVYTDQTDGSDGKSFRAVYGTWKTTTPGSNIHAGDKVEIIYYSVGGAWLGVGPVSRQTPEPYVNLVNNGTATANVQGSTSAVGTLKPNYYFTSVASTANHAPDIGLSNQEPGLYSGVNVPAGQQAAIQANLAPSKTPLYDVVNGIVVTDNLYAVKKNWSKAEIAAIWLGNATDWSFFKDDSGTPLAAGPIFVADRNIGSGAEAAFLEYFLNNPNGSAVGGNLAQQPATTALNATWSNFTVPTVTVYDGAGKVYPALNNAYANGARAIGILGGEYVPGAASDDLYTANKGRWKHVKIHGSGIAVDGVDGSSRITQTYTADVAASGAYDFVFQASTQTSTIASVLARDVFTQWVASANNPAIVSTVPGVLLDPIIISPGSGYDAFTSHGSRFGNSHQPIQLLW